MSGHTPGPWFVGCQQAGNIAVIDRKPSPPGDWGFGNPDGPAEVVCFPQTARDCDAEANALLIAAAPELLEALRALADDIQDRFDMNCQSTNPGIKSAIKQARAAIAKAATP